MLLVNIKFRNNAFRWFSSIILKCMWVFLYSCTKIRWRCYFQFFLFFSWQTETKNEQLQIYYKVCYARVLDYRRKFIEAAQRYLELSYRTIIHEEERLTSLNKAVICTVLASAGKLALNSEWIQSIKDWWALMRLQWLHCKK